jgi:lysyl-tRNA synthetase class 1
MQVKSERRFWVEKLADEVVKDFPNEAVYRTENGIGASGFPHIGSISDAVRSYGVKLSLEERGLKAEHIAFSDDKDGLRKVPQGLPDDLKKYIGVPVTSVPDPFHCHGSYGEHMGWLLLDGLDRLGIVYKFYSGAEVYRRGLLNDQIRLILVNWRKVGQIISEVSGQTKYTQVLPYLPVCEKCGRIYTTEATEFDEASFSVAYTCKGGEIGGKWYDGCGHSGDRSISDGEGKLAWKAEFAARWAALGISFEAYGKELTDSVLINDRICWEVLGRRPPVHTRYELFLSKGGKKLSKSSGELVTHDEWLKYGSPASLRLLMYKRFEGAREVGIEDVPVYMDELDALEEIYFGIRNVNDTAERQDKVSLYRYAHLLRVPDKPSLHPPYNLLVYLAKIAPDKGAAEYVLDKLKLYGYTPKDDYEKSALMAKVGYAINWARDHSEIAGSIDLDPHEKEFVSKVAQKLSEADDEAAYQQAVYAASAELGVDPKRVFKSLYKALIGQSSGPRFGSYVKAMGKHEVIKRLLEAAGSK